MHLVDDRESNGARRRAFLAKGAGGGIPGLLWSPTTVTTPLSLVLVGHGASGSKEEGHIVRLCRHLATRHGLAAAAIDGPVHGDRRRDKCTDGRLQFLNFAKAWATDPLLTDKMVEDWRNVLDELFELEELSGTAGYWGLSMGTILGLPLVAAEARVRAAVLGLMGLIGPTKERLEKDAANVSCPVLFLVQWSDAVFARSAAFELFDCIASSEKVLHANPGAHGALPAAELGESARFLARHLSEPARPGGLEQTVAAGSSTDP
ncbi:MAG: alpha/beta hydrolase [Acidimicrobiales bacterium]